MHGMIMDMLQRYVVTKLGADTWTALRQQAGVGNKTYFPVVDYEDSETLLLVKTASDMTGLPVSAILEDFGVFIAADLYELASPLIDRQWKTLDFLENIENVIHKMVRIHWKAHPPVLKFERTGPDSISLIYTSKRKMCHVAIGIVKGLAKQYNEQVIVSEPQCMLRGAAACHLNFQVTHLLGSFKESKRTRRVAPV